MLFDPTEPADKRRALRAGLASGRLLRIPGAFSPLVARLIAELGFEGVYVSGAVVANDLGLPDIGLTTLTEVAQRGHQIARVTALPTLIDIDTGFGEPMNAARTLQEMEDAGLAACHLEDQVNPKRCGHLEGKLLVGREEMEKKIHAAARARRDPAFVLIARTDARAVEGLPAAIERARAYVEAGADAVFPEALQDEEELRAFRHAVDVPLLANMTEFGRSPLLDAATLGRLGYNMAIYPVTGLRLAIGAVEAGFRELAASGTQAGLVERMQTRARLYELVRYADYGAFDATVAGYERKE